MPQTEAITLYHATSEYSLPKILAEGIRTRRELPEDAFEPEEWKLYGKRIPPQISLTDDLDEVLSWSDVVIVVTIPKSWTHQRFDPKHVELGEMREYNVYRRIPPSMSIKVIQ